MDIIPLIRQKFRIISLGTSKFNKFSALVIQL
jgi:hypothetical protein